MTNDLSQIPSDLLTYLHQISSDIIRCSLTYYLPTQKSDVICECSLTVQRYRISVVSIFQKSEFSRNKVIVTYTKYKHSLQFVFMGAVLLMLLLEKVTYKLFTLLLKCRHVGRFSNPGWQAVKICPSPLVGIGLTQV